MLFVWTVTGASLILAAVVGAGIARRLRWRVSLYRALLLGSLAPWILYLAGAVRSIEMGAAAQRGPTGWALLQLMLPGVVVVAGVAMIAVAAASRVWSIGWVIPLLAGGITWKMILPALWQATDFPMWYDNVPAIWLMIWLVAASGGLAAYTLVGRLELSGQQEVASLRRS